MKHCFVLLACLVLAQAAWADKIVLDNNRTVEGVIQSKNDFYININVRGTLVPIPRERIREIVVMKPNENIRFLLDRTTEAVGKSKASAARAQLEQAKAINTTDSTLRDEIAKLDRKVIDLERSGGNPDERRHRAQDLLRRANEAYDRIQNEVGNDLLIEALRTDPTYEPAHQIIDQKLNIGGSRPDLMLAAEYFAEALWPDNMKADSVVVPLLPKMYVELTNRFGDTIDLERANRYYDLLNLLSQAFAAHPEWVGNDPEEKRVVEMPFNDLMADLVGRELGKSQYQLALDKLNIWTQPGKLGAADVLFARAYIGQKRYDEALKLLEAVASSSSGSAQLQVQAKAAKRLVDAEASSEAGKTDEAITTLETIFYSSEQMLPEIRNAVGLRLAELKESKLKTGTSPNPWMPAEVAALNLKFNTEQSGREAGFASLRKALAYIPWHLDAVWSVNGTTMNVPTQLNDALVNTLSLPMAIQFSPNSPFNLRVQIDLGMSDADAQTFVQSMETGNKANFPKPVTVNAIKISVEASYPALPPMLSTEWSASALIPANAKSKEIKIQLAATGDLTKAVQKELPAYISPAVKNLPAKLRIPEPAVAPSATPTPAAE